MTVRWNVPPERAFAELSEDYVAAIRAAIGALANRYAPEIETWLMANAPWTDRTSNARQTLWSQAFDLIGEGVLIVLSHGMDYGIFLELAHGGTYAVIGPALHHFAPRIWADILVILS